MREDMHKVIVERPRRNERWDDGHGKHGKREQNYVRDPDSAPTKEPLRARDRRSKSLNENLSPLVNFLVAQVGRPWNKVYSELRARFSPRSAVQKHVFDHIWDTVHKDVIMVDGVPCKPSISAKGLRPIAEYRAANYPALYVCPDSGILKRAKMPQKKIEKPLQTKRLNKNKVAVYWKNCWHEATMEFVYTGQPTLPVVDVILGQSYDTFSKLEKTWGLWKGVHQCAVSIRPMKRNEIRNLI